MRYQHIVRLTAAAIGFAAAVVTANAGPLPSGCGLGLCTLGIFDSLDNSFVALAGTAGYGYRQMGAPATEYQIALDLSGPIRNSDLLYTAAGCQGQAYTARMNFVPKVAFYDGASFYGTVGPSEVIHWKSVLLPGQPCIDAAAVYWCPVTGCEQTVQPVVVVESKSWPPCDGSMRDCLSVRPLSLADLFQLSR